MARANAWARSPAAERRCCFGFGMGVCSITEELTNLTKFATDPAMVVSRIESLGSRLRAMEGLLAVVSAPGCCQAMSVHGSTVQLSV